MQNDLQPAPLLHSELLHSNSLFALRLTAEQTLNPPVPLVIFLFRLKSCKIEFGICVLCLVDGLSVSELYRHLPLLCESPHINLSNTFCLPPLPSPLHRRHRNLSSQPNLQKRGGWSTTSMLNTRSSLGSSLQLLFTFQHVICNEYRNEESLN